MKVLSLFDGISCGRVALERAGIEIEKYYASEIDDYAMAITQFNYPDTIQLGDITQLTEKQLDNLGDIDIVIGGSPCQDLSNYKYDRGEVTGLNGEKSGLFYHYVRVLKHVKPKYFLLENVASMENKWKDMISEILGVQPMMINSALVCAAERKRYYWMNWNVEQPKLFETDKEEVKEMEETKLNTDMIQWDELDDLIGKPVFDKDNDEWRILKGYQRMGNDYSLTFTDSNGDFEDVDLNCTNLFLNEEFAYQK